jgi:hypothetical protein
MIMIELDQLSRSVVFDVLWHGSSAVQSLRCDAHNSSNPNWCCVF